jgi:hypothetical protein
MRRKCARADLPLSVPALLAELDGIGETILLYQSERGRPRARHTITKMTPPNSASTRSSTSTATPPTLTWAVHQPKTENCWTSRNQSRTTRSLETRARAFHGLHADFGGSALPAPHPTGQDLSRRRRLRLMLRTVQSLPPSRAFDTALQHRAFPPNAGSLLPGFLATTRTGLSPASDDELTTTDHLQQVTSSLLGARRARG